MKDCPEYWRCWAFRHEIHERYEGGEQLKQIATSMNVPLLYIRAVNDIAFNEKIETFRGPKP